MDIRARFDTLVSVLRINEWISKGGGKVDLKNKPANTGGELPPPGKPGEKPLQ